MNETMYERTATFDCKGKVISIVVIVKHKVLYTQLLLERKQTRQRLSVGRFRAEGGRIPLKAEANGGNQRR